MRVKQWFSVLLDSIGHVVQSLRMKEELMAADYSALVQANQVRFQNDCFIADLDCDV